MQVSGHLNNIRLDPVSYTHLDVYKRQVESNVLDVSRVSEAVLASGSFDDDLYAMCIGLNSPCLLYTSGDKNRIIIPDITTTEMKCGR